MSGAPLPLRLFAYGSLIWRPSFPFVARAPAALEGFSRKLWQGSTDHRGVPGAPGRVVTLVREPGARCLGVVFSLAAAQLDEVLSHLDVREQGGYEREVVRLVGGEPALAYVGRAGNPEWLGPAPVDEIAAHVARSRGPSGDNREYVLRLVDALRELGVTAEDDSELFAVDARLRAPAPVRAPSGQPGGSPR
jgi:cation transport protein ChaC